MKKTIYVGSLAVVLAAVLWSLDGLLRRQLFSLPPTVVVFWEHIFGFVLLLPLILIFWKKFKKLNKKQWLAIIVVSLLSGALGTIFYTAALGKVQFMPFSVVVLLQQLQPLFAITAAAILLKEKIKPRFIFLALLALLSAYGVSFPDLRVNFATGQGTAIAALLALAAAAAWGFSTAFSKYSLKGTSPLLVTWLRFGFAPIFALLLMVLMNDVSSLTALTGEQWKYIAAITFSTGLVALLIYYFGLKRIPASRSTLLELAWPISSVISGYVLLKEALTVTQSLSAVILILVMLFIVRDAQKNNESI
ncbi:MAG: hypothetical protein A2233_00805 [Candidatus Kerfeldbacteria bacterium RIFOXYA2_FULL_38_24]|uniref:EamA domain-containing protein n=1 Tax=Candidatus Kerfeldbacteria bacterium RIFOXYB2_FULL_38_14 TaxID=1798547 RepID=A0A1G2BFU4_9BACT|nr:MAG: hypothetical protein A2233_00805 [Candidatus Kerfeldbacteria bacterium RIFOXYA2_FULL_38_24]OGY88093.1 MAG: hypothetical protein A2319_01535 [Candidatus Kerfeldbacteria bacterium RIFOXYB2_FULL_38_14]OGY88450.1 MAG: hypothetical protein A2458_02410 [Candidatus Kerfeldbacteria bacterium RIFOXYC2_FULL_38_9]